MITFFTKCLIFEFLWELQYCDHDRSPHKMSYFWVNPHRGLRSWVAILISASLSSADSCPLTSKEP